MLEAALVKLQHPLMKVFQNVKQVAELVDRLNAMTMKNLALFTVAHLQEIAVAHLKQLHLQKAVYYGFGFYWYL